MNTPRKGHVSVTPNYILGLELEVANPVVYGAVIPLGVGGCGAAGTTHGNRNEGVPTATTCSSGAGCPSRTNVGLADEGGELNIGALAGHAWESPAAPATTVSIAAATEGFDLGFCECFELDHLVCEMSVMGLAQPLSTCLVSSRSFFSPNAATWIPPLFFLRNFISSSPSVDDLCIICVAYPCVSLFVFGFSLFFCVGLWLF